MKAITVGSVNANKRHWYKATQVLAQADRSWLAPRIDRQTMSSVGHSEPRGHLPCAKEIKR
jgi:phage baseplate assembly protein gpV